MRAFISSLLLGAAALPATAQFTLPAVQITEHPQPARIGVGDGVAFRVAATIAKPHRITRYEWRLNGLPIKGAPDGPDYTIAAAAAGHAGIVSVMVYTTAVGGASNGARLEVVQGAWAMLSGRALSTRGAAHTPSLERCDGRWLLAWTENTSTTPAVPQLRASAFDGTAWRALGTTSLAGTPGSATAWATDPSLQCTAFGTGEHPVLAWTEASGPVAPKTLHVKRLEGTTWLPVGAPLASGPQLSVAGPLLRLVTEESDNAGGSGVPTHSLRALLNAGRVRHERWDGAQWAMLGEAAGHTGTAPMVVIDTASRPAALGGARALAPLQLASFVTGPGQSRLAVVSSQTSWAPLGDWLRPASASPPQLVGIGFGAERSLPRAVAMWREAGATPTLASATLAGADYQRAFDPPGLLATWQPYADPLVLPTGSLLFAHDAQPQRTDCDFGGRSGFGVAVAASTDTRVWFPNCPGGGTGTAVWLPVGDALPLRPASMALKMQDREHPLIALVSNGRVEVWRWVP